MLTRLEANADPNLSSQDEDTAGDMSSAFLGDVPVAVLTNLVRTT